MAKWFIVTRDEVRTYHSYSEIEPDEYGYANGVFEAETRNKAKYQFCKTNKLPLLTPIHIFKVYFCDKCNGSGEGDNQEVGCLRCLGTGLLMTHNLLPPLVGKTAEEIDDERWDITFRDPRSQTWISKIAEEVRQDIANGVNFLPIETLWDDIP